MPNQLKSRDELPWLYYPRSNSVRVINSHLGGGSSFDPSSVSGLWFWHDLNVDGDALNTISPDVQATDGQSLRRVLDRSGNTYHTDQSTAANRPLFESSEYTKAAVRFDGSNDYMAYSGGALDLINAASGITFFAALRFRSVPTTTKSVFFVNNSSFAGSSLFNFGGGLASGKYFVGGRRLNADSFQFISSTDNISTSGVQIVTACTHFSDASALIRVNQALQASTGTFQTAGSTENVTSLAMSIGAAWSGVTVSSAADVDIFEALVYKAAVSTSDIDAIETYLAAKHQ